MLAISYRHYSQLRREIIWARPDPLDHARERPDFIRYGDLYFTENVWQPPGLSRYSLQRINGTRDYADPDVDTLGYFDKTGFWTWREGYKWKLEDLHDLRKAKIAMAEKYNSKEYYESRGLPIQTKYHMVHNGGPWLGEGMENNAH